MKNYQLIAVLRYILICLLPGIGITYAFFRQNMPGWDRGEWIAIALQIYHGPYNFWEKFSLLYNFRPGNGGINAALHYPFLLLGQGVPKIGLVLEAAFWGSLFSIFLWRLVNLFLSSWRAIACFSLISLCPVVVTEYLEFKNFYFWCGALLAIYYEIKKSRQEPLSHGETLLQGLGLCLAILTRLPEAYLFLVPGLMIIHLPNSLAPIRERLMGHDVITKFILLFCMGMNHCLAPLNVPKIVSLLPGIAIPLLSFFLFAKKSPRLSFYTGVYFVVVAIIGPFFEYHYYWIYLSVVSIIRADPIISVEKSTSSVLIDNFYLIGILGLSAAYSLRSRLSSINIFFLTVLILVKKKVRYLNPFFVASIFHFFLSILKNEKRSIAPISLSFFITIVGLQGLYSDYKQKANHRDNSEAIYSWIKRQEFAKDENQLVIGILPNYGSDQGSFDPNKLMALSAIDGKEWEFVLIKSYDVEDSHLNFEECLQKDFHAIVAPSETLESKDFGSGRLHSALRNFFDVSHMPMKNELFSTKIGEINLIGRTSKRKHHQTPFRLGNNLSNCIG